MMSLRRHLLPLLALLVAISSAPPAHASNQLMHVKYNRTAFVSALDSVLFTLSTGSRDTLQYVMTDDLVSGAYPDTVSDRGNVLGGLAPTKNLYLVVEITGATQSLDSLYLFLQYTQGLVPGSGTANGQTNILAGGQSNGDANWRWYDGIGSLGALTGGLTATVVNAGTATFVFPIPCVASNANAWLAARAIRGVVYGDSNASAVGINARSWFVWRTQ